MQTTIAILLPIFGFIACGYGAALFRIIDDAGVRGIMTFVLYFAIPALLFRAVVQNELPGLGDLNIVLAYYGGCFLVFAAAVLFGRIAFSLPIDQQGILGMGAMYSNTVLLGMPLVFTMFGEAGIFPVLLIITFHNVLLFPVVIVFIEIGRGRRDTAEGGAMPVLLSTLRGTIENPVIIALVFSFLWAATGLGMPGPMDAFTGLLGKAVAPAALFALGASMAGYRIAGALSESLTMVGFKLFVHPALVWLLGRYVFDLQPLHLAVVTITAAVPVGANVFVLAHKYGVYLARATSALVISAALSVVTLAVVLALFAPG
jgi:predicted permease